MYTKFYGLREKPFAIAPDPAYFFASETHRDAMTNLVHCVNQNIGIVLVTGDPGAGKTMVSRRLQTVLAPRSETVTILDPRLTPLELMAAICDQLGVSYDATRDDIPQLLAGLDSHLVKLKSEGRSCVVLIDEAQRLAHESLLQLRDLIALEDQRPRCLHVILFSENELQQALGTTKLRPLADIITSRVQLTPLHEEEIGSYILHRLTVAGGTQQLFSDEALRSIYELSLGLPGRINQICDRALLAAFAEERRKVMPELVRWAARETAPNTQRATKKHRQRSKSRKRIKLWASLLVLAAIGTLSLLWIWLKPAPPSLSPSAPETASIDAPGVSTSTTEPAAPSSLAWPQDRDPALSRQDAFKALFGRWQLEWIVDEQMDPCDFAHDHGLDCGLRQGNWAGLVALNRPVVLELRTAHQTYWAALLKIDNEQAYVAIAEAIHQFPVMEVERSWNGRFYSVKERE